MIPLSFSRLQDLSCPYLFYRKHIARDHKEPETDALKTGSAVHKIMADYLMWCLENKMPSDISFFDKVYVKDETIKNRILELVENAKNCDFITIPESAEWFQVESRWAFDADLNLIQGKDAWFDKSVAWRAVVDYAYVIGDTLYIRDFKTGYMIPQTLQLDLYAFFAHRVFQSTHPHAQQVTRIVCIFDEIATKSKEVKEYTIDDLPHAGRIVREKLELANSLTEYPAIACSQCKFCTIAECSLRIEAAQALITAPGAEPALRVPDAITTTQEAEKAMMFLQFAESITGRVTEILRKWVEDNGPVYAGGKVAELRDNKPWKVKDLENLARALVAYGVPKTALWQSMSMSEGSLENLAKKAKIGDRLPMLLAMGERKEWKPKFGLFNDKIV